MTTSSREGSPLSSLASEEDPFEADEEQDQLTAEELMPPAKRQKTGISPSRVTPVLNPVDDEVFTTISSDTDGELPSSPNTYKQDEDENHEQVTACAWDGCDVGDLGNMDNLVDHIHNEHIETRQKKYTCEWSDCLRKSMPHASGYALKAHMRSHTREKPFYCALPECDRAFTRSDALAKHMRTVHETEALRPSDPIPKSMQALQPAKPMPKLKFTVKSTQSQPELPQTNGTTNGNDPSGWKSSYPPELGFTRDEEERGPQELFRLLRRQVHWAEEEADSLKRSVEMLEELRRKEWIEKEILLDQAVSTDLSWHERRRAVLASLPPLPDMRLATGSLSSNHASPAPLKEPPVEEAAAVLASLHQG